MSHTTNFLISSSNASRSSLYIDIILLCESYSLLLCHTGTSFVAASSSRRLLVYIFLISGGSRSPTRNRSFSFLRGPLGRAGTYNPSTPRISLSASPLLSYFLALAFPFLQNSLFCFCLVPAKLLYRQYLFLVSPLIKPSIFYRLRYPISMVGGRGYRLLGRDRILGEGIECWRRC